MDGQAPAVNVVGCLAQKVKELGVDHAYENVEGAVRVGHDEEQGGLAVSQRVQRQLVAARDLAQLGNVEGGEASAAAHEYALGGLAGRELVLGVLAHGEVPRVFGLELIKQAVHGVLELLVVLADFHAVEHFKHRAEVLLLLRGLIMDVADERHVEQLLGVRPELVALLPAARGVGYEAGHEL